MPFRRRAFLRVAVAAAALPAVARMAGAGVYPSRPLHLLVGYPPGLAPDIVARLIAQFLSERLGQQVIVENRPGAGSNIAAEAVVRAAPDGYTVLLVTSTNTINATLYDNLSFDLLRDISPVAGIAAATFVVVVSPSLPVKSIPELIAYAKSNPGKINMASAGNGTASHVFGEMFKAMTGVDLLHVPYRGNYYSDLMAGQMHVAFTAVASSIGYIRSGKFRVLAVTGATRAEVLPDVPTVAEFVPGYEATGWYGVGAPKDTAPEIIDHLNKSINAALADPKLVARIVDLGNSPLSIAPAEFGKLMAEETEKWRKVIRMAKIKPE